MGCGVRDIACVDEFVLDEIGDKREFLLYGLIRSFDSGHVIDESVLYEASCQAAQRYSRGWCCHDLNV